ncbi:MULTISPECIES: substrate-binding periplasmic protein [Kordiimonas]|jgi:polar amino acid transport system substrate-binding protein|uniref:substrate-binding periplasmic protein n=1 Tax=Kordiimonas TaxID=288021 RepID=UPI00257F277E|nr:transporter substrate-binding domain-containing protein [Kordiimonas sp. UBA4487]
MRLGIKLGLAMLALVCGAAAARAADGQPLIVYTENYPPFNYAKPDGSVAGLATDRVRQVLDAAGLQYEIKIVPWARAMNYARTRPDALIYTITRTPRREYGFDWLVLLAESNFHIFARAEETRPVTRENLEAGMFTASCVSGDLTCELLVWAGVPVANIIPIAKEGTGDFRMVLAGRADLYISDFSVNRRLRKAEGYSLDLTKPVMRLDSRAGFYLASGLNVPADIRARIKASYEQLKASGDYQLVSTEQQADGGR